MPEFNKHFRMTESDIIKYSKEKSFFNESTYLHCDEIGDGNINYVFRVTDVSTKKSIIIKQADVLLRSSGRDLSTQRSRIEAEAFEIYNKLVPNHVPNIYLYDPVMCLIVMQDIKDYENMRYALLERKIFSGFAENITNFLSEALIGTTDHILNPMEKKRLMERFVNPELCEISEKLVFTEPYTNYHGTNVLFSENTEFFEKELYSDNLLCLEAAKLKESFKSNSAALIHGDLHTGSIFIKEKSVMVLDPEFAFYGPLGYDIGNVIANLIFAWVNTWVTMERTDKKDKFIAWLESTIKDIVDLFYQKSLKILEERATERMTQAHGFAQWYLENVLKDAAGMAGLEINRRVVGDAKVKDIAGIECNKQRKLAERICVLCAKQFVLNRNEKYQSGKDYITTIHEIAAHLEGVRNEK